MIRRPPRSTLFPSRRSSDLLCLPIFAPARAAPLPDIAAHIQCATPRHVACFGHCPRVSDVALGSVVIAGARGFVIRSEEHTSELQSQFHLVCRLLLEKKKKK